MGCFWFHLNPSSFLNALLTQATKPSSRCRTTRAGGTSWNFPANLGVWTAGHVCVLHITIAWIDISAGGFLRKTGEQMPSWTHNWLVILGHFRAFLVLVASQLFCRGNKHGICLAWHVFLILSCPGLLFETYVGIVNDVAIESMQYFSRTHRETDSKLQDLLCSSRIKEHLVFGIQAASSLFAAERDLDVVLLGKDP